MRLYSILKNSLKLTKKELNEYVIDIYLYKDKKYKTLIGTETLAELRK